jgi:hypothetical protein
MPTKLSAAAVRCALETRLVEGSVPHAVPNDDVLVPMLVLLANGSGQEHEHHRQHVMRAKRSSHAPIDDAKKHR